MRSRSILLGVALICVSGPGAATAQDRDVNAGIAAAAPRFLALTDVRARTSAARWRDAANEAVFQQRIALNLRNATLKEALHTISEKAALRLTYSPAIVQLDAPVSLTASDITVGAALSAVLYNAGVDVLLTSRTHAALIKRTMVVAAIDSVIAGVVVNAASGDPIQGAQVVVQGTGRGVLSDENGSFRITGLQTEQVILQIVMIGYRTADLSVRLGNENIRVALREIPVELDELVATGVAFAAKRRSLPNPINVITAREIEAKGSANIVDLLRGEIPGVMALSNEQNDYYFLPYVRGNSSWTAGDFIKTYIDGVEVANAGYLSTIDPKSIERVELVRGPQAGTIYGSGSSSGVLQIITKKGTTGLERPRIDLQASLGMIESNYTPASVSRPITHDHALNLSGGGDAFSYRAGASYGRVGEWVRGFGSETLNFSGGLRARQGPLTAELTALWSDRDLGYASRPIFQRWPASTRCPYCGQPDLEYPNYEIRLGQSTTGLTLRYQPSDRWQHTLTLGEDQNRLGLQQPEPHQLTPSDTFVTLTTQEERRRSVRYHTAYATGFGRGVTARFTAGLDYWNYEIDGKRVSNLLSAFGFVETSSATRGTYDNDRWHNVGYFGMVELGANDEFFVTLAARAEDNPNLGEEYGLAVSPRIGAAWVRPIANAEVKLRAQYGKGIRPPPAYARVGRVVNAVLYAPNPEIGPEEKAGWDAGIEVYWGNRASLSVTRYDEEGTNLIQGVDLDLTSNPKLSQYQNIGRVSSAGWEIEGTLNFGAVTLMANYAYTDNVIRALSNQYAATPNQVYQVGDRMLYVPRHSGGGRVALRLLNGSVAADFSVMDEARLFDYIAYFGYLYGGEEYRGSTRAYYVEYPALWRWNLYAEQSVTDRFTAYMRVNNVSNNQDVDLGSTYAAPGRATVLGLRVRL